MDQNRQKLLIGVLAVAALGAGSYFLFLRPEPSHSMTAADPSTVQVRERTAQQSTTKTRERERPTATRQRPEDIEVAERARPEDRALPTRTRARGTERIEKKKELKPAA